jgi:hypothetical protein
LLWLLGVSLGAGCAPPDELEQAATGRAWAQPAPVRVRQVGELPGGSLSYALPIRGDLMAHISLDPTRTLEFASTADGTFIPVVVRARGLDGAGTCATYGKDLGISLEAFSTVSGSTVDYDEAGGPGGCPEISFTVSALDEDVTVLVGYTDTSALGLGYILEADFNP